MIDERLKELQEQHDNLAAQLDALKFVATTNESALVAAVKERDELAAHVERLREALYELHTLKLFASEHTVKYTPKVFDTAEAETEYKNRKPLAWANARRALASYPAQSLTHVQAQVEEETIEHFCNYVAHELGLDLTKDDVANYERKYAKDGE